jgi:hypothetical protein
MHRPSQGLPIAVIDRGELATDFDAEERVVTHFIAELALVARRASLLAGLR